MSRIDKLFLWGAVAIMVAVGSLSAWKVSQSPKIDPEIAQLKLDYERLWNRPAAPVPAIHVPNPGCKFNEMIAPAERAHDWTGFIHTKYVGIPIPHPDVKVYVLSLATPKTPISTLDGTTFTWSLVEPQVELKYWMKPRVENKPTGFIIKRQADGEEERVIAEVGPKEFSYTDLATQPRRSYRYWVQVKGKESDLSLDPPPLKDVVKGLDQSVKTRTPSDTRAKLVGGGEKGGAFIRIDTYDRVSKKWIGKTAMAAPGQKIGPSGWILKGLRFDNFTLVADVTDDEGVDRVLTTKD